MGLPPTHTQATRAEMFLASFYEGLDNNKLQFCGTTAVWNKFPVPEKATVEEEFGSKNNPSSCELFQLHLPLQTSPGLWDPAVQVQSCFTSTETLQTIRGGEPRMATSTFTQLLGSEIPDLLWPNLSPSPTSEGKQLVLYHTHFPHMWLEPLLELSS